MKETSYYRFESGNVILRKTGDRVEKFGKDGVWVYQPSLLARFMNGEEGLTRISAEEAKRMVDARQR